jgi:carboxyl-terminal processing protease
VSRARAALIAAGVLALASSARADDAAPPAWHPPASREPFHDGYKAFERVRRLLESSYVDKVSDDELWRGAAEGMLARAGGRAWDQLLSPSDLAELKGQMKGEVVGVGVEIKFDTETGIIQVKQVIPGSGAAQAGLAGGDAILRVDGRSFQGREYRDVLNALRGSAGTTAELSVLRGDRVVIKRIKRAPIAFDRVSSLSLPGGVGLVAIRSFGERTPGELKAALATVAGARAVVLDLRHNPGGLLDRMVDCAGLLLPPGAAVATLVERGGGEKRLTAPAGVAHARPLAVLVDDMTASSAEVLAGALREGAGARLVGKRTQGKWNVQRLQELENGWVVKLTVALIRTPSGLSPDGKGLLPDVPVEMTAPDVERVQRIAEPRQRLLQDPQLATAVSLLAGAAP